MHLSNEFETFNPGGGKPRFHGSRSRYPSYDGEDHRTGRGIALLHSNDRARGETATLVFTPDRLGVIKGAPAARRAYFDRVLGRLAP